MRSDRVGIRPRTLLTSPRGLSGVVTLVVFGIYSIGAGRAWGFDASVTVHRFIVTPSLLDPFRKEVVYNNHVLFSFVDHLVYSITGVSDERMLRVVPVLAAALSVGVTVMAVARRLGTTASLCAGAVVAANPILVSTGRDARGYSMLLLFCVLSTALLFELRAAGPPRRTLEQTYVLALAAGIATHLYGLAMIPVHAAVVAQDRAAGRRWVLRWIAGAALGLLAYVAIASTMLGAHRGRHFRLRFPWWLARDLLGGTPLTIGLLALPTIVGITMLIRRAWATRAAAAACAVVLVAWLLAPTDLYVRFFIWLVPAAAYLVALGVRRFPWLAVLVAGFVIVEALRFGPNLSRSDMPNRTAAALAREVARSGGVPCAFGPLSAEAMEAYDANVETVLPGPDPPACDLLLAVYAPQGAGSVRLPATWRELFRYRTVLPAISSGVAFYRHLPSSVAGGFRR